MLRPGLASVTFRKLAALDVLRLAREARLEGIEWGGDVHVPPGDVALAQEIAAATTKAGLAVSSYGSYYRVGDDEPGSFEAVLETALALSAPMIRVWAGRRGSAQADADYRRRVSEDSARIAALAGRAGLQVAFEFHGQTLTDTPASARDLLESASAAGLGCYWQPAIECSLEQNLHSLRTVLPWLANLHVYHWDPQGRRLPLSEGQAQWRQYFELARQDRQPRWVLLEFVAGDDPAHLVREARSLIELLAQ